MVQRVDKPFAGNQRFISDGLKKAVVWPNSLESLQIEAAVDML